MIFSAKAFFNVLDHLDGPVFDDFLCVMLIREPECIGNFDFGANERKARKIAIIHDPMSIYYLPKLTREEINLAIRLNYHSYKRVPYIHRTYEMTKRVIQKDGNLIEYVTSRHITPELAMIAIEQNPESFKSVPRRIKLPEEFLINIVSVNPALIQYIPRKQLTPKIIRTVLDKDITYFRYIDVKYSSIFPCDQ